MNDKGYQPSISADPFYADPSSKLYPKIREIAMGHAAKMLQDASHWGGHGANQENAGDQYQYDGTYRTAGTYQ